MTYPQHGQEPPVSPAAGDHAPPSHGYTTPGYSADYRYAGPPGSSGAPTAKDLSDAATANYLGILGWIGPLIFRVMHDRSPYVKASTTAALNFHISMVIYQFGSMIVGCLLGVGLGALIAGGVDARLGIIFVLGYLFMFLAILGMLAWSITASCIGGSRASRGEIYRYPGSIKFIKK